MSSEAAWKRNSEVFLTKLLDIKLFRIARMMADYEELLMDLLVPSNWALKLANKTQLRYK